MRQAEAFVADLGSVTGDSIGANHGLIQNLFALDKAQAAEIDHLRATVDVLVDMLIDAGVIDEKTFGYRLEAEFDRVDSERREEEQAARLVECYSCGKKVDPKRTQVDAVGTICDVCFNSR